MKRGLIIFLTELFLIEILLFASGGKEWHHGVAFPLAGFLNLATAWFLYLKEDKFLVVSRKKEKENFDGSLYAPRPGILEGKAAPRGGEETPLPYRAAFLTAGVLFLAAATFLYLALGVGSRYFL